MSRVAPQIARPLALVVACGLWGVPAFGTQPATALSLLEIRDVDNRPVPSKEGRLICRVEGQNENDRRFVKQLWDDHGPAFGFKDWSSLGPDSMYRQIRIAHGGKVLTLKSWHSIYERDRRSVVTSQGVMPLGKRSRAEVLRKDDRAYLARRAAFDRLLERCLMHNRKPAKR